MTTPPERRHLVFIESNTSGTGRLFISAAREMGFNPVLVTANLRKYDFLFQPGAPELLLLPRFEEKLLEQTVRDRYQSHIAGITSSSEYFIAAAAKLAARLGLPGPDPDAVEKVRDKSYQRDRLGAAGFSIPEFRPVDSVPSALAAARQIGFPVVVKPVDGTGSVGVRKCPDAAAVESHVATLLAPNPDAKRRLLVEAFIPGEEFSVEVFSNRIVGITRKHVGEPPWFVETGHDYPAKLPEHVVRILTGTVLRATSLLHLTWGPIHWELRIHRGDAFVMEVNPRLAGGFIPELVRHAQGLDLIRQTLQLAAGQPAGIHREFQRHASIRFLCVPRAGRLLGVEKIQEAFHHPDIVDIQLYRAAGAELNIYGDFRDRVGHVIACASESEAASSAAERARRAIHLSVERVNELDSLPAPSACGA